jgi:hypothetical protein
MAKDTFGKLKDEDTYEVRLGREIEIGGRKLRPGAEGTRYVLKGKHVKANAEAIIDAKRVSAG